MNNIVTVEADNFPMLIETRRILEINTASLAAQKANDRDIVELNSLLEKYREKAEKGENAMSEDLLFHLKIADISKNSILKSLIMIITPEVQRQSQELNTCKDDRPKYALAEHQAIFEAIKKREPEKAAEAMAFHMGKTVAPV
ncbi:MAG: FadR family transcriptional regulator [Bacteroidetes bacterium]|nr:FadR family transcriptional regulator [Bacteroidota bacterium]